MTVTPRWVIPMKLKTIVDLFRRFLSEDQGLGAFDYVVLGVTALALYSYLWEPGALMEAWSLVWRFVS